MRKDMKEHIEIMNGNKASVNYKKVAGCFFPKEWKIIRLKDYFERISQKNIYGNDNVLTISAQEGLISQKEFFNRSVAGEDKTSYFLMKKGDFAYNKSYSKGYPFGAVKRLDRYDEGIVSPLYICMSCKYQEYSDYFTHYFECGLINREIKAFAQEGARNHGLLNIGLEDFFNMKLCIPDVEEAKRITSMLEMCAKEVKLLQELIFMKNRLKKGLIQKLDKQELKIDGHDPKYKKVYLKDVLNEVKSKKGNHNLDICSVAVNRGVVNQEEHMGRNYAAEDTTNYNVVNYGDIVYTKSPTGQFPYGIIKQSYIEKSVAVSPLYGVFTSGDFNLNYLITTYFQDSNNVYRYLHPIVNKGAKNTINISNNTFLSKTIILPTDEYTKEKLVVIFDTLCAEIGLLEERLEMAKLKKRTIMKLLLTGAVRVNEN